jgi:hypothetical protein
VRNIPPPPPPPPHHDPLSVFGPIGIVTYLRLRYRYLPVFLLTTTLPVRSSTFVCTTHYSFSICGEFRRGSFLSLRCSEPIGIVTYQVKSGTGIRQYSYFLLLCRIIPFTFVRTTHYSVSIRSEFRRGSCLSPHHQQAQWKKTSLSAETRIELWSVLQQPDALLTEQRCILVSKQRCTLLSNAAPY